MKKIALLFCSLFVISISYNAVGNDKKPAKKSNPDSKCCTKAEERECLKESKAATKRQARICCDKKKENS